VMLASQAMLLSGVPLKRVLRRVQENRAGRYAAFNGYFRTAPMEEDAGSDSLQSRFLSVRLMDDSIAVGKKLGEIGLAELSIEVNAVRRRNVHGAQPSEDMLLQSGDILVLLGLPEALQAAESLLHKG
jgi:CPA2 family monovalent cation:H+ antiporter-2